MFLDIQGSSTVDSRLAGGGRGGGGDEVRAGGGRTGLAGEAGLEASNAGELRTGVTVATLYTGVLTDLQEVGTENDHYCQNHDDHRH